MTALRAAALVHRLANTLAFERRCIRSSFVALLRRTLPVRHQLRASLARRIDALGASRYLRDGTLALLAAACLVLLPAPSSLHAASESPARLRKEKARLEEMKRKATRAAADLAETMAKEKMTRGRMKELQEKLARQKRLLARLDRRLADLSRRLGDMEDEIRRLDAERESSGRRMAGGTARIFEADRARSGTIAGDARDERLRYFAGLVLSDEAARYGRLSVAQEGREEQKAGLERTLEASQHKKKRELSFGQALASRKEAEGRRLAEINRKKRRTEKELKALRARIAAMEALVTRIERRILSGERRAGRPPAGKPARFASVPGGLVAPLPGRVVGRFGKQRDPAFDVVIENRGVEIEAPSGAVIRAVGKGEVVFLGSVNGYGEVLILQHGSGLFSVYGKAESFSVKYGQVVMAGQPVGRLPANPDGKSVLYLELRAGGTAIDPLSVIPIPHG
ncbi:MAG: peptidoglycan DD-metalloendopeptidase family protein [Deltaproteobacteria bacterium]|nr:peptidoglycan DD-metalloendopeptidase family protein [Deltaproteobacteria bacterium]